MGQNPASGWAGLNQNLNGGMDAISQHLQQQKAQQDAIKMLILKAQLDQQGAIAQEQAKADITRKSQQQQQQDFMDMLLKGAGQPEKMQQSSTPMPLPMGGGQPMSPMAQNQSMGVNQGVSRGLNMSPVGQAQPQQTGIMDNANKMIASKFGSGYEMNPNSISTGKMDIQKNPDMGIKSSREERLVRQQQFSNTTKLRQEFINRPEVKDYTTISPNIRAMDSLLKNGLSGNVKDLVALDQGLITMFNKLTDPQSVVRESEYARTPSNLPFINRFSGAFQKLAAGGAGMTNDDRKSLVQGAKIIANERGAQFQKALDEYKGVAADYGLDESLITRDMPSFKEWDTGKEDVGSQQGQAQGISEGQTATNPQTRQKIIFKGGQWQPAQ